MNEEHKYHLDFIGSLPQHPQRSLEWLEQRKNRLTSSDAATALGINPYKKPVELLLEKCGAGRLFTGNEATEHGNKYEDDAIDKYTKLMGKQNYNYGLISFESLDPIRKKSSRSFKYIDSYYHFLAGSPDGIAIDTTNFEVLSMVEVKCPMRRKIKHGQIPVYYFPQVQINMFILDLEIADFIEYIPATDKTTLEMNIVRVHRDEDWFDRNVIILKEFWDQVIYWRQHDITTHPEYSKYYKTTKLVTLVSPPFLFIDDSEERPVISDANMFLD